jgi:hypothetical protein
MRQSSSAPRLRPLPHNVPARPTARTNRGGTPVMDKFRSGPYPLSLNLRPPVHKKRRALSTSSASTCLSPGPKAVSPDPKIQHLGASCSNAE